MSELIRIKEWIAGEKKPGRRLLVAIDGKCASGKTTLAQGLQENLSCSVFHMDDFFLRPEQRTSERYKTPGGNVDYERFAAEILQPLRSGAEWVTLRAFDCRSQTLREPVSVKAEEIVIVEGAYSCHPELAGFYDLRLFMDISVEEQKRRILRRNGPDGWKTFAARWIPLEELYFTTCKIKEKCDLFID